MKDHPAQIFILKLRKLVFQKPKAANPFLMGEVMHKYSI